MQALLSQGSGSHGLADTSSLFRQVSDDHTTNTGITHSYSLPEHLIQQMLAHVEPATCLPAGGG